MRVLDLYSGIGGWKLGFELSGFDVVQSYEWWHPANETHNHNFGTENTEIDIRQIDLENLPENIDVVIGSPPCTEFSFANRGGNGNMKEGLKDIRKFLEVVRYLRPKYWAMENVPRVSKILNLELSEGGSLYEFRDMFTVNMVVDMSEFGLPQRRKRMIAGNFPSALLGQYRQKCRTLTLGDVLSALNSDEPKDLLYNFSLPKELVTDNDSEVCLSREELRLNKEAKTYHPVYNTMQFPEVLNRPSRTVTATCTRVSRESLVVEDPRFPECYRRLTVRERASLQGFPITFQFYGNSHTEKLKMVGNAVPPYFTYYIAQSMRGTTVENIKHPYELSNRFDIPIDLPKKTTVASSGHSFSERRRFRLAIPGLRYGSGFRFELSNQIEEDFYLWDVRLFHGPSKGYVELVLSDDLLGELISASCIQEVVPYIKQDFCKHEEYISCLDFKQLQKRWSHKTENYIHPFHVVDTIGDIAKSIGKRLETLDQENLAGYVTSVLSNPSFHYKLKTCRNTRISENCISIMSGMLVGSWFNSKAGDRI